MPYENPGVGADQVKSDAVDDQVSPEEARDQKRLERLRKRLDRDVSKRTSN